MFRRFHPKDPAHGTLNYDIGALNEYQKRKLNVRKSIERKENEMYFKMHPEIKGLISILLRYVLHRRPTIDVHQTMAEFFNRPHHRILVDLLGYFSRIETETENETETETEQSFTSGNRPR